MRRSLLALATAVALSASVTTASASTFLFQWDDAEPGLTGNTYQDGQLIQTVLVGNEQYNGDYGLWNSALLSQDISVDVNIFERDGSLSDTWRIFGTAGDSRINIPFFSDVDGQALFPLPNGFALTETGDWQTVTAFDVSNGDQYIWQFRSDIDTPEPGALAVIAVALLSLLGLGVMRRRADA